MDSASGHLAGRDVQHFKVLALVGTGGVGTVYKAEDTRLKRTVALKFLAVDYSSDHARSRFLREARAVASLDHPNICPIYEIGEWEGQPFLALAFLEGPSLQQRLRAGRLNLVEALDIAIQICRGLTAAHVRNISHLDIKPGNLLLGAGGLVRIVDFGLAYQHGDVHLTAPGTVVGTPMYMAPEQWRGQGVDRRADLWAVGAILYQMTTGKAPFSGSERRTLAHAVLSEDPPRPSTIWPGVPTALESVIQKALAKNADERYQSAEEMIQAISAVRDSVASPDETATVALAATEQSQAPLSRALTAAIASPGRRGFLWAGAATTAAAIAGMVGYRKLAATVETGQSIAVLPFNDLSPSQSFGYFADGMTDELIAGLTQLASVRVVARTSTFQFKGKNTGAKEVGQRLNVKMILSGSIRIVGDVLRVVVNLVSAPDESITWAETFERKSTEVFAVQGQIISAVQRTLGLNKTPAREASNVTARTPDLRAYDLYLRGRSFWDKRSEAAFRQAIAFFEQAIKIDPSWAPLHTGLADTYTLIALYGWGPSKGLLNQAQAAANKSVQLDPQSGEGHTSIALAILLANFDAQKSQAEFQRALELNPGYMTAHHFYAHHHVWTGRFREANDEIRQALDLDPLSVAVKGNMGWFDFLQRRFTASIAQMENLVQLEPGYSRGYYYLSCALLETGDYPRALAAAETAVLKSGEGGAELGQRIRVLARSGKTAEARQEFRRLREIATKKYISGFDLALASAELNEKTLTAQYIDRCFDEGAPTLVMTGVDTRWDKLREHPKLSDLQRRLGLI